MIESDFVRWVFTFGGVGCLVWMIIGTVKSWKGPMDSTKLIPDGILKDRRFRNPDTKQKDKSDSFVRLFGINQEYDGELTYGEDGRANTPFYVGDELTKREIYQRLLENGLIERGKKGKRQTENILKSAFPERSIAVGEGYIFEKLKNLQGQIKYKLRWEDFVGFG